MPISILNHNQAVNNLSGCPYGSAISFKQDKIADWARIVGHSVSYIEVSKEFRCCKYKNLE